jgi:hypothetical protein
MGLAARENRGPLPLSIVGSFCPLPWLEYAGYSVVPNVCHLAAAGCTNATRSAAWGRDIRESRLATILDEPAGVGPVGKWPRYGVPELRRHDARSDSPVR